MGKGEEIRVHSQLSLDEWKETDAQSFIPLSILLMNPPVDWQSISSCGFHHSVKSQSWWSPE